MLNRRQFLLSALRTSAGALLTLVGIKAVSGDSAPVRGGETATSSNPGVYGLVDMRRKPKTLAELVAGITPDNRHAATEWGRPVGHEVFDDDIPETLVHPCDRNRHPSRALIANAKFHALQGKLDRMGRPDAEGVVLIVDLALFREDIYCLGETLREVDGIARFKDAVVVDIADYAGPMMVRAIKAVEDSSKPVVGMFPSELWGRKFDEDTFRRYHWPKDCYGYAEYARPEESVR